MAKKTDEAPAKLLTHHVFLDTDVYRQLGHNYDSPVLNALGAAVEGSGLVLHATDITLAEIRRQLRDFVAQTAQELKAVRKKYGRWRKQLPDTVKADVPELDAAAVAEAAFEKLHDRIRYDWNAHIHIATDVHAADIFKMYFDKVPPFAHSDSKEFPDAFVVKALEKWCRDNGEKMYVVTRDKAMTETVRAAEVLIPASTLEDVLDALAATETPDIREKVEGLLSTPEVVKGLHDGIGWCIDELIPVYVGDSFSDGEVTGHAMRSGDVEIADFKVVAESPKEFGVLMEVTVPIMVNVAFNDMSSASYDREDGIYYGVEHGSAEFEADPEIRVFARLTRNPPGVASVRILTGEVEVSEPYDDYM